jgi:hypothetical protein
LQGSTLGLGKELVDVDVVGTGEGGNPLQPGVVGRREDREGQGGIVQVACKITNVLAGNLNVRVRVESFR